MGIITETVVSVSMVMPCKRANTEVISLTEEGAGSQDVAMGVTGRDFAIDGDLSLV